MERDLLAIQGKCGTICADGVRENTTNPHNPSARNFHDVPARLLVFSGAIIFGVQQFQSFNKTMSLRQAHEALAPFSLYSSDGGHEAVEDLLLLLSLTFEDYALALEPGAEPEQGAVAFLVAMIAGLPVTMLRLAALIQPAAVANHTAPASHHTY